MEQTTASSAIGPVMSQARSVERGPARPLPAMQSPLTAPLVYIVEIVFLSGVPACSR